MKVDQSLIYLYQHHSRSKRDTNITPNETSGLKPVRRLGGKIRLRFALSMIAEQGCRTQGGEKQFPR